MHTPETISRALDRVLPFVQKPARYTGGEFNSVVKDWDTTPYRLALVFPDVYDLGMSNLGLAVLYDIVNRQPDMLAERGYTPWVDMLAAMRREGIPLYSLESRRPLAAFDVIGFTLPYEQLYTNVLTTLDLAGIPLRAADRGDDVPLILAGGSACLNPEPMHAFFDAFFIGEGEDAIVEIVRAWTDARREGLSRAEALAKLAQIKACMFHLGTKSGTARMARLQSGYWVLGIVQYPIPNTRYPIPLPSASSLPCPRRRRSSSSPSSTSSTTGRPSKFSGAARAAVVSARPGWCSGRCASGRWRRCWPRWMRWCGIPASRRSASCRSAHPTTATSASW